MSSTGIPTMLRLGAVLAFTWAINNKDGTQDTTATISNVDLVLKDVKDKDGNEVDASEFATIEKVDEAHDKATLTDDEDNEGLTGTFEGTATVSWPDPADAENPIVKTLVATGTATISTDPSAGDTLAMVVTIQDA